MDGVNGPGSTENPGGGGNGDGGGQAPVFDLKANIPDEFKEEACLQNITDFPGMVKSFVNAQKLIGGEKVVIPKGTLDTPENWDALFTKLGRPETPDKYEFEKPELPEGMVYNEELEKRFKEFAHKTGLLPAQAQAGFAFYNEIVKGQFDAINAAQEKAYTEGVEVLRKEFGGQFEQVPALANQVLAKFGGEQYQAIADKYMNDPFITGLLARVGMQLREDGLKIGDKGGDGLHMDAAGAKVKRTDIMTNKDNPLNAAYFDKKHPRHLEALNEVNRLFTIEIGG